MKRFQEFRTLKKWSDCVRPIMGGMLDRNDPDIPAEWKMKIDGQLESWAKQKADEERCCSEIGLVRNSHGSWTVPIGYRLNESVEYMAGFWTRPNGIALDYDRGGNPYVSAKMEDSDGYGQERRLTGLYRIPEKTKELPKAAEAVTYDAHGNPLYGDGAENI